MEYNESIRGYVRKAPRVIRRKLLALMLIDYAIWFAIGVIVGAVVW